MRTLAEIIEKVHSRYMAETKAGEDPKPDRIQVSEYGNHASYVQSGFRYWGFVSEKGRDKFVRVYRSAKAL